VRYSVDTNILVYSVDRDAVEKHRLAAGLLDALIEEDCVLTLQALAEFFHLVTRKGYLPAADARAIVEDWAVLFPVVTAEGVHLRWAMASVQAEAFSFWDGLLFSTANRAGVTHLLSEDMQHGFERDGTRLVNPYAPEFKGSVERVLSL